MRNYDQITVQRGAVHVVNPRQAHLGLTEAELDLGHGVDEFLAGHVSRGLVDPKATAAQFVDGAHDGAAHACQAILDERTGFVTHTAALATQLYNASEQDDRVSDGTVAVLACTSSQERFVAIVKLDPSNGYRAVEDTDSEGKARVRLVVEPDILPSVRERVQKCAFVRATKGDDMHMLLVDRQRRGDVVSRFFIEDFLGAEPVFDSTARTKALYRALTNGRNDVSVELTVPELARLDQYIEGQVVGERVAIDELVEGLPLDSGKRERIRTRLDSELADREFDLDPDTARSFVRQRRFAGDNNLRLTVPADFYDDMIVAEPPNQGDGRWTITIRTHEWRQT